MIVAIFIDPTLTSCGHLFCKNCRIFCLRCIDVVMKWLKDNATCPACRTVMMDHGIKVVAIDKLADKVLYLESSDIGCCNNVAISRIP